MIFQGNLIVFGWSSFLLRVFSFLFESHIMEVIVEACGIDCISPGVFKKGKDIISEKQ